MRYENDKSCRLLPSGFYDRQTYGGLKKAWKGYIISRREGDSDRMVTYASRIQKLQKELGLPVSSFPNLRMHRLGEYKDNASRLIDELEG